MEFLTLFFTTLFELSNEMAPYILFGLIFAGFLHEVVPETIVKNHLGKNSIGSVIKAAVFGIPLPVCSCGVIPLAASLKKSGASNGSVLSFLISTPITGVDSILATYGMFGWAFTIYRVITSVIISIIAGIIANFYTKKELFTTQAEAKTASFSLNPQTIQKTAEVQSCCSSGSCCSSSSNTQKTKFSIKGMFRYAFVTLLGDIAPSLLVGLLVGALITVAIPQNLSEILLEYTWLSYIIVIIIAVPMYVCATASLPIAAGLMLAGVSPGAAFVFLSAGPATNTVTIGVVKEMLGKTSLAVYLSTIVVGSVLFGLGLDIVLKDISVQEMIHLHEEAGLLAISSSVILWGFVLYFSFKSVIKRF
ncbi:SO_0444 family Cu/Zn efflux transporter [Sulfurimonas sp. C5]|uniref:SO_0444 family Cu/Zn efflux transporter n=1 Tax=Sulfurimonas sp. C5 TaxID=3036947 RepID=UPI002455E4D2|nr:SO_0444 family Cu/Zn efflux transporter [Sulfurimonas sp. C5]MDH4944859.1 SO_0444 family Cu/Zn efflux transporter [Sulfurimonas sp. C5]